MDHGLVTMSRSLVDTYLCLCKHVVTVLRIGQRFLIEPPPKNVDPDRPICQREVLEWVPSCPRDLGRSPTHLFCWCVMLGSKSAPSSSSRSGRFHPAEQQDGALATVWHNQANRRWHCAPAITTIVGANDMRYGNTLGHDICSDSWHT